MAIINFIRIVKDLGYLIKLDTNGYFYNRLNEIIKNNYNGDKLPF